MIVRSDGCSDLAPAENRSGKSDRKPPCLFCLTCGSKKSVHRNRFSPKIQWSTQIGDSSAFLEDETGYRLDSAAGRVGGGRNRTAFVSGYFMIDGVDDVIGMLDHIWSQHTKWKTEIPSTEYLR